MMGQQVAVWGYLTEGLVESGIELCEEDMQLLNPKMCTSSASQLERDGIRAGGFGFAMLKSAGRFWSIQEKAPLGDSVGALGSRRSASAICLPGNEAAACCVAGYTHAVVGTEQGGVYVWHASDAQLQRIGHIYPKVAIDMVAAGEQHSLALSGGAVWSWGSGAVGQLGLGRRIPDATTLQRVEECEVCHDVNGSTTLDLPAVRAVAAGAQHSAVVTDEGKLFTFGWGLYGQCGHDSTEDVLRPRLVPDLQGIPIRQVAPGLWHTACLTEDGGLYTWGGNADGQLGTGLPVGASTPQLVEALPLEEDLVKVSCGARHTVVLTGAGKVFSWGWNKHGQLGHAACSSHKLPSQVEGERAIADVACGWWHTLVQYREL